MTGQGTYVRQYKVHVPASYDPKIPAPVVFGIHGLAQNPVMFCVTGAALDTKAHPPMGCSRSQSRLSPYPWNTS